MAGTETRLLPKSLVHEIAQALARLRFARDVDRDHPVVPASWRPHPVDCDICSASRRVDIMLDLIREAIGKAQREI